MGSEHSYTRLSKHAFRARLALTTQALLLSASVTTAVTGAAVSLAVAPLSAAAYSAPAAVQEINSNNVTSGHLFGGRVQAFTVDPINSNLVYAATELGGIYKSTDGGANWTHIDAIGLTASTDVKIAGSDSNLIVATGAYDGHSLAVGNHSSIWTSTDAGVTWNPAAANADDPSCTTAPSANRVSIAPGTPGSLEIVVATNCGVTISIDSGAHWSHTYPASLFANVTDVKTRVVSSQVQIDLCGTQGYFRSANGGGTWSAKDTSGTRPINPPATFAPCYVATVPQDANTVLLSSWTQDPTGQFCLQQLLENDASGAAGSWTAITPSTSDANCRVTDVITHPAFDGNANHFEAWFGTNTRLMHSTCDSTATPRCNGGSFSVYDNSIGSVHNGPDSFDLAFPSVPANACPFLESSDGGAFSTSNGCNGSPTFAVSNNGMHALQATQMAGTVSPGFTDLEFGTQDNGLWHTADTGASWTQQGPDVYATYADHDTNGSASLLYLACFGCGISRVNPDATGSQSFNTPPGNDVPNNFHATQFAPASYLFITPDGPTSGNPAPPPPTWHIYATPDAGAHWSQGPQIAANSPPIDVQAAGPVSSPVFYLRLNVSGNPTLFRFQSGPIPTNGDPLTGSTLTQITGVSTAGAFAVNPTNPNQLYAADSGSQQMLRSTDGGATWTPDAALLNLVTQSGLFPFNNGLGNVVNSIAFDGNSSTVLVGTQTDGLYASVDGGADWITVRGSTGVSRPVGFFFDETRGTIFAASAGRGLWKVNLPHADLQISLSSSPSPLIAGNPVTYSVSVFNAGPDPAGLINVKDNLPSGLTFLSSTGGCFQFPAASGKLTCPQADLPSGASVSFQIKALVSASFVAATSTGSASVSNTATVSSGDSIDPAPVNNSATDVTTVTEQADLQTTEICDSTMQAGQTGTCNVYIDNVGPSYARNVVLTLKATSDGTFRITQATPSAGTCGALPPAGTSAQVQCSLASLQAATVSAPGRWTTTFKYTATEAQTIAPVADANSSTPDPDTSNNDATASLPVTAATDLQITGMSASPSPVVAGTGLTFVVTITNAGPSTATNVVVKDAVPAGVVINSVSAPSATNCSQGVPGDSTQPTTCGFDVLAPSISRTLTISTTVLPQTTGILHNAATVSSDTFDPDNSNNFAHTDTTVNTEADISVSMSSSPNPVVAGTSLTYRAVISNIGPSRARTVVFNEVLAPGANFGSTSISNGGSGTCAQVVGAPSNVQCQLNDLDPGQSVTVYTQVAVASSVPQGTTLVTTGSVSTSSNDPNLGNNSTSTSTAVNAVADLAATYTGPATYKPSTTITYVNIVSNYGPSDAVAVQLVDTLPGAKVGNYVSDNSGGLCSIAANILTCNLGTLPAGASRQVSVMFFIQGNAKLVVSTNSVSSPTTDPNSANNSASWSTTSK